MSKEKEKEELKRLIDERNQIVSKATEFTNKEYKELANLTKRISKLKSIVKTRAD